MLPLTIRGLCPPSEIGVPVRSSGVAEIYRTMTQTLSPSTRQPGTSIANADWDEGTPAHDQRNAPRFTLLMRAAKLIAGAGEFLVVVRDVSCDGLKVRTFHPLPPDENYAIELSSGDRHQVEKVWQEGELNGFRFQEPVALDQLLSESPAGKRKRPVRLQLKMPVTIFASGRRSEGLFLDISQNGACIASDEYLALDERIRIECDGLPELTATVRWRRRPLYGLNFEQIFRFDDLARLTARMASAAGLTKR